MIAPTQEPLVSIVTPVYNEEEYLRECIESVLAQTYQRWDYTIVNNCSTDRTLDIAQEYAAIDKRIRIHNNESFVPVIANYNIAFRQIAEDSKYCKVVGADDLLFPECLERMVGLAETHPRVAIVGSHGLYSDPTKGVYCRGIPYSVATMQGRELCRSYLLRRGLSVWGSPTFVLFRSDIVRSRYAFFNESNIHADSEACVEFLRDNDFGFVHQILTLTRIRDGSLTEISEDLNTYLPYRLSVLGKFGHLYLTASEEHAQTVDLLRAYYRYLAWQARKWRGAEFWRFHRSKLSEVGHPLSIPRLGAYILLGAMNALLNPGQSVERLVAKARARAVRRAGRSGAEVGQWS
jgi:glycosyltransferase involved in cell wall biosynthesis